MRWRGRGVERVQRGASGCCTNALVCRLSCVFPVPDNDGQHEHDGISIVAWPYLPLLHRHPSVRRTILRRIRRCVPCRLPSLPCQVPVWLGCVAHGFTAPAAIRAVADLAWLVGCAGLSYTNFTITWTQMMQRSRGTQFTTATSLHGGEPQEQFFRCVVKNTGTRAGDEIVFAFIKPNNVTMTG